MFAVLFSCVLVRVTNRASFEPVIRLITLLSHGDILTGAVAAGRDMDAEESHFGVRSQSRIPLPGLRCFNLASVLSAVSQYSVVCGLCKS